MTWDLRPESILPAGFIYKAGHSEGTELCQASWLPGFNAAPWTVRKNDSVFKVVTGVMFPRPCSIPQQVTGEGTEHLQASWPAGFNAAA